MLEYNDITKLGQERANPYADLNNTLKLPECEDCGTLAVCEDSVTSGTIDGDLRTITSVVYNGTTFTPDAPIAVTDEDAIEAFLGTVFETLEIDSWCKATWLEGTPPDGTLTIEHYGAFALTNIILDDATDLATARCCVAVNLNEWKFFGVDTIGDFGFDGATDALANNPYAYTGVPVTDAATAVTLQADVVTALGNIGVNLDGGGVTVTVNDSDEGYDIVFISQETIPVTVGASQSFDYCGSEQAFVCP